MYQIDEMHVGLTQIRLGKMADPLAVCWRRRSTAGSRLLCFCPLTQSLSSAWKRSRPRWTSLPSHRAPLTRRAMARAATISNRSPEDEVRKKQDGLSRNSPPVRIVRAGTSNVTGRQRRRDLVATWAHNHKKLRDGGVETNHPGPSRGSHTHACSGILSTAAASERPTGKRGGEGGVLSDLIPNKIQKKRETAVLLFSATVPSASATIWTMHRDLWKLWESFIKPGLTFDLCGLIRARFSHLLQTLAVGWTFLFIFFCFVRFFCFFFFFLQNNYGQVTFC